MVSDRDSRGRLLPGNKASVGHGGPYSRQFGDLQGGLLRVIGLCIEPHPTGQERREFHDKLRIQALEDPIAYMKYIKLPALKLIPERVRERMLLKAIEAEDIEIDVEDVRVLREIVMTSIKEGTSFEAIDQAARAALVDDKG